MVKKKGILGQSLELLMPIGRISHIIFQAWGKIKT
jgi:hypothetical protein